MSIEQEYFDWLVCIVCGDKKSRAVSYEKLLAYLHSVEFTYTIPRDQSRYDDGVYMRYRFSLARGYDDIFNKIKGPCSVLEMMVALAVRCEKTIMDNPDYGDRTGQWFWGMVVNLGLGSMTDSRFNERVAEERILRFLNREYDPDGRGGLFTIRNCKYDVREFEIWWQMCHYLNGFS